MDSKIAQGLEVLFQCRSGGIVLGLTGRTGSGCTTTASILSKESAQIALSPEVSPPSNVHHRKDSIIRQWHSKNWSPFIQISVSNIIISFLFEQSNETYLSYFENNGQLKALSSEIAQISQEYSTLIEASGKAKDFDDFKSFSKFYSEVVPRFARKFRNSLDHQDISVLQALGDNLRRSGKYDSSDTNPKKLFTIPDRIRWIIGQYRKYSDRKNFVIDALRNPFEALYYKERFPSFYLIAINAPDEDRRSRLSSLDYKQTQITALDKKEYPEKNKPLSGYDSFISQNIQSCIQKADIHINNEGTAIHQDENLNLSLLTDILVKYVALIQHPGLVTPTRQERCMQVAYTAKLNSGCISRQVGAVVTNKDSSIVAIGWNDVPFGQVPCLLRKADDLILKKGDSITFSDYERTTKKISEHLTKMFGNGERPSLKGRNVSFCFKDAFNTIDSNKHNQVHTRSLHAEENAFLQVSKYGGQGVMGGGLYTTASPCELCAKKAVQLGIKEIYYIDPYPGISTDHVLASGNEDTKPKLKLFTGAIGDTYHKLYSPILPYKDEIIALLTPSEVN